MARMKKTTLVALWWGEVLKSGQQLPSNPQWTRNVLTDDLWKDFLLWLDLSYSAFYDDFNKNGFFTIFYPLTGAEKKVVRRMGEKAHVARFGLYTDHKKHFHDKQLEAAA